MILCRNLFRAAHTFATQVSSGEPTHLIQTEIKETHVCFPGSASKNTNLITISTRRTKDNSRGEDAKQLLSTVFS